MTGSRVIGLYRREPCELPHHKVKVEENDAGDLMWFADGEEGWILTVSESDDTLLLVDEKCPHYEECKQVIVELEEDKVVGLRFNGELYSRKDFVFEMPDDVSEFQNDCDNSSGAVDLATDGGFETDDED